MSQEEINIQYMERCLQLAKNGLGYTSPNPMVGCVLVYNHKIIGEGWHQQAGSAHAEVNAINQVKDKNILSETTAYVSLEPCAHYGKTPPCADLLIKNKIKRVVIGTLDPFIEVAGKGIKKLWDAGIAVSYPVLEKQCQRLNKRFLCFHQKKRPYIILKWAQSADELIAPKKINAFSENNEATEISNLYARQQVHQLRTVEDAFLIGVKTALIDNPKLTSRLWSGKNPLRILIDKDLKLPSSAFLFDDSAETLIINQKKETKINHIHWAKIDFKENVLKQIMTLLHKKNIQSLVVEGGAKTIQTFIDEKLWDEALVYSSKQKIGIGIEAPKKHFFSLENSIPIGNDNLLFHYKPTQQTS